jgi:hypothetical protein
MNALQFFTAQIEADQRFRRVSEAWIRAFQPEQANGVQNAPTTDQQVPPDNQSGLGSNPAPESDLPTGNIY